MSHLKVSSCWLQPRSSYEGMSEKVSSRCEGMLLIQIIYLKKLKSKNLKEILSIIYYVFEQSSSFMRWPGIYLIIIVVLFMLLMVLLLFRALLSLTNIYYH